MQTPQHKSFTSSVNVGAVSQPRHSKESLSAFQVPVRGSNTQINDVVSTANNAAYVIAIVALLMGVVGVLVFLLFL